MIRIDDFQPMLLDEPGWIYELKMDGYGVVAEFDGSVQLCTRNGTDATTAPACAVR
jgi:ATP-dependent DNA ligase